MLSSKIRASHLLIEPSMYSTHGCSDDLFLAQATQAEKIQKKTWFNEQDTPTQLQKLKFEHTRPTHLAQQVEDSQATNQTDAIY